MQSEAAIKRELKRLNARARTNLPIEVAATVNAMRLTLWWVVAEAGEISPASFAEACLKLARG